MKNTQTPVNCLLSNETGFLEGEKTSGFTWLAVPFSAVEEKQVLRTFGLDGFVSRTARAPYFSPAFEL